MEQPLSPEEWGDVFDEVRPTYVAFSDRVEALLEDLLDDEEIAYTYVLASVDSFDAFVDRIYRARRHGLRVDDPLSDLPDFARVEITAHLDDVESIEALVHREFEIDADASRALDGAIEAGGRPSPTASDELTIAMAKLVVSLPEAQAAAWRAYTGLRVVVHVVTLVQDAWNTLATSHLPYRHASSYPSEVREALREAMARCAAADDAIADIWRELARAEERYEQAISQVDLDLPLDAKSLGAYLFGSEIAAQLVATAETAGMEPVEDDYVTDFELELLLWTLARAQIRTVRELDEFLRHAGDRAAGVFGKIADIAGGRGFRPEATRDDLLQFLLLVLDRADGDTVALTRFGEEIEYALNTLIGNPVPASEAD